MMKLILHFEKFTKWTIVVVNNFIPSTLVLNQQRPPAEWAPGGGTRSQRMSSEKMSWPEVVGWPVAMAVTQVNSDRLDVAIEVVPSSTNVVPRYNTLRVHVYFDAGNASGSILHSIPSLVSLAASSEVAAP
jgi:hypothetical protein